MNTLKKCSASLNIRETQMKTIKRNFIPSRMTILKTKTKLKKKRQALVTMCKICNSCVLLVRTEDGATTMENTMVVPQNK